jgi:hypothetical protein
MVSGAASPALRDDGCGRPPCRGRLSAAARPRADAGAGLASNAVPTTATSTAAAPAAVLRAAIEPPPPPRVLAAMWEIVAGSGQAGAWEAWEAWEARVIVWVEC